MIVVGVDPSLTGSGLARIAVAGGRVHSVATLTVASSPCGTSVEARSDRLKAIVLDVIEFIPHGSLVVIEAPAYSRNAGSRHERSGLWWLIVHEAKRRGCRVVEVSPKTRAKFAAGGGNAGKAEVLDAMRAAWPAVQISDHNQADGLALAALGMRLVGVPVDAGEPHHVAAVAAVAGEL